LAEEITFNYRLDGHIEFSVLYILTNNRPILKLQALDQNLI